MNDDLMKAMLGSPVLHTSAPLNFDPVDALAKIRETMELMRSIDEKAIRELAETTGHEEKTIRAIVDDGYSVCEIVDFIVKMGENIKSSISEGEVQSSVFSYLIRNLHENIRMINPRPYRNPLIYEPKFLSEVLPIPIVGIRSDIA